MTTVSNEKLLEFRGAAKGYLGLKANEGKFSKFLYALSKMMKATKKAADELDDKITYLNLEYAEKDSKGFAVVETFTRKDAQGNESQDERYKYTTAGAKKLHEAKRKLMNEEVEVDTLEVKGDLLAFIPADMDFHKWQYFAPFVLPEEPEGEVLEKLIERTGKQ